MRQYEVPVMPNRQPVGTGMERHEVEAEPPVPMPLAQPVGAAGAQQMGAFAEADALLGQAAAGVNPVTHLDHHHPAGILRHEVDLTRAFTHVASEDAEAVQAKEGGREILRGAPAFVTRNDPAHRRRSAGASGISSRKAVGGRTHALPQASFVPRGGLYSAPRLAITRDYSAAGASGAESATTGAGVAAAFAFTRPLPLPTGPTLRRSLMRADFPLSSER